LVKGYAKSLLNFVLDGLRDPMKQMKTCEMKLKKPQNGVKLSPKSTPRNKRNRFKEKHKRGGHLQR
jgi:hypothetical protein